MYLLGLPPDHADTLLGIIVRKKSKIFSSTDQAATDHVTTAHLSNGDSEDSEKEEVKISGNVMLTFADAPPSLESTSTATSLSHSHSQTSILDSGLSATSSSMPHSQCSLSRFGSGSTLAMSHSDSQDSILSSELQITAVHVPKEELNIDHLSDHTSSSSSDDGFVSTDDSNSSQELSPLGDVRPHPLPLLLNKTTDDIYLDSVTEPLAFTSDSDDQPSAITLEEGESIFVTGEAVAQDVALPQSSTSSEPFSAHKVKSEDDKKVEDVSSEGDKVHTETAKNEEHNSV